VVTVDDPDDVALTAHTDRHGCSCKVEQRELDAFLREADLADDDRSAGGDRLFGVGADAAARRLADDLALVSTVDFFTPVVDDPYDFGQVAASNAASDAFATGAVENLDCLVVLGLPAALTDRAPDVLAGMADALETVGGAIVGGHTVVNPWPVAGGAVTATAAPDALRTSGGASPGDRLYLTKPLGTQSAMAATRVTDEFAARVADHTERPVDDIGADAVAWMTTMNRDAALAARPFASAMTDVTGFGLAGQARVLAARSEVGVEITRLPVIDGTPTLSRLFGHGLVRGESAETSGGLLCAVPPETTADLETAFEDAGVFYREVGAVAGGEAVDLSGAEIVPVRR
jgi:selenide,water dikinase